MRGWAQAVWQHHWRQPVIVCFTHSQAAGSQAKLRSLKAFKTARAALNVQQHACGYGEGSPLLVVTVAQEPFLSFRPD
jgi:hypothetical protein